MICVACKADNRDDRRFCAKCGAALPVACRSCGFANDARDAFCGGCGTPLNPGAEQAAAPAPALLPAGERRQVTILFADLVGFTRLTGELGAEAAHRLVNRYLSVVDDIATGHGGATEYIGDAAMVLFGAPIAHSDDPLRAVRAASAIHAAMPALSVETGQDLQVHIGIASGEVVAAGLGADRKAKYTVIGESVNLASRLDSLAAAGETLISDAVFQSIGRRFDCRSAGEVSVKGFDQPIMVWRVLGEAADTEAQFDTPFVGRQAELRQFQSLAEVCRDTSSGRFVLLRGEAGMGKTRLAAACTEAAQSLGFQIHRALVLDFGAGKGQDAIRALVRSLLRLAPGASKDERAAAADRAIASGAVAEDQRVFLSDLLNLPQSVELRALYDAMDAGTRAVGRDAVVTSLVQAACRQSPTLLLVEDVHWADAPIMATLASLARVIADVPALLMMTTRLDGDPVDPLWRAGLGGCPVTSIDLNPLRAADAVALAAAFGERDDGIVRLCIERAEGNPLFLEQLLRNAEEQASDIPGSIQSLVQARLDRLEPRDRRALQAASVIGQRFPLGAVRALAGDDGYDCAPLLRHRLIRPEGDSFLFAHALIREGVYGSLLAAHQRELHGKAARWYGAGDVVLRAQHLDRAEDPGTAAAYLEAARAQSAAYANDKALELLERGLAVASSAGVQAELLLEQGTLLLNLGQIDRSDAVHRQALSLSPDDVTRCRALLGMAAVDRARDRYPQAFEALNHAQDIAARLDLPRERGRIHYLRGNLYFPLGRYEECLAEHERALVLARQIGSAEDEARALSGLGDAAYARGRMLTAGKYFRDCVDLARRNGLGRIEVANLPMVAMEACYALDLDAALRDGKAAMELAVRVGDRRSEMIANHVLHEVYFLLGNIAQSRRTAERSYSMARELKARRFECEGLAFVARIEAIEGQRSDALEHARQALEIGRETAMRYFGPWTLGLLASVADTVAVRRAALAEAEAILRDGAVSHNYLQFYPMAMQVALVAGEWDEAERYAALLEDYTQAEPLPISMFEIASGRALAAHGRGRRDPELSTELRRLIDFARQKKLVQLVPQLEEALARIQS